MNQPRRALGCLVAIVVITLTTACSSETSTRDLEGQWTQVATPTTSTSSTGTPTANATPTASAPSRPAAVTKELDELARNLRDLSRAESSRDAMPALASALAATRADVKQVRARAFGADKSCGAVEAALSDARANAARTADAAAVVRARNEVRTTLLTRTRATLTRLAAATTAGGRKATADESAAIADAKATIDGAADQIGGTSETASSAVSTAQDLRDTAASVAGKAC